MTETILPHELAQALERAPGSAKVLSLDCFDTLLWRDCHAPVDVFAALPDVSVGQRIVAETNARKVEASLRSKSEVALKAVYDHALPNAKGDQKERAIAAELQAEARACFAFAPTVALMRAAQQAGLKVIIVSDTYLTAPELLGLIKNAAGEDVTALIDKVFSSSDAGISKAQGLLARALKSMRCRPDEILHIGDNEAADFHGARALGIPALHLVQFSERAKQRLRFERTCQQIIGDQQSDICGLQPHRALLAYEEPQTVDPANALGLTVLGPVFQAFDEWLRVEAQELAQRRGGRVHWLFMLRDGHLPFLIHEAGGKAQSTARVEISRFVATAASLANRDAYNRHLALEHGLNPKTLARQMLLEEGEISKAIGDPQSDAERVQASRKLLAELRKGQTQKRIQRRARGYADRLIAHVRAAVDPQPGDTLMLVDLGYNGSAQNRIDALLQESFNCHVAGRYLLLREMDAPQLDKRGLIDARNFDPQFLEALCANVAVIEQLATCEQGSVVDYTPAGDPIRTQISVKGAQSFVRERVQQGAVQFAKAATSGPVIRAQDPHHQRAWREGASGCLMRFMFLPQPAELEVLKRFEHDVNLGSDRMVGLFDQSHALEGIRRRGLFYMKGSARMFLPAELADEDMNTRLSLIAQKRFGLGLSYADQSAAAITMPAIFMNADNSAKIECEAMSTHAGYYAVRLPITADTNAVALQFGAAFDWIELASVGCAPISGLKGGLANDDAPTPLAAQFDGITEHGPGILECTNSAAFLLVNQPSPIDCDTPHMVEIVFRPLRMRAGVAADAKLQGHHETTYPPRLKDAAA